jgi:hypothetical protein
MILKFYDEFGIYTDKEEIENFIESLIKIVENNEESIFNQCINHFGQEYSNIISN